MKKLCLVLIVLIVAFLATTNPTSEENSPVLYQADFSGSRQCAGRTGDIVQSACSFQRGKNGPFRLFCQSLS